MKTRIERLADAIDRLNTAVGRVAMWGSLFIVLAGFSVVVLRYLFGTGSLALSESVIYAQAALFLLASPLTLRTGGHVRVDVFYGTASPRTKALVDLAGSLVFLLPFAGVLVLFSVPYAARSWSLMEHSREASGLPLVYLLKTLIPVFAVLLGLQGIAQAIRAALVLLGPASQPSR